jgi:hypothetical protein
MPSQPPTAQPDDRRDQAPAAKDQAQPRRTPGTDMQPEDTGTPESGQPADRAAPPQPAMKQTSKTGHESGSRG